MGNKIIEFSLDTKSLNNAIKQVEQYRADFNRKWNALMNQLIEEGAEIAKAKVKQLDAVMFGDLLKSIEGFYVPSRGIGVIRAGAPHAIFVEYGTGVTGQREPHPEPMPGWRYDVNDHGEEGWWYWGDWDGNWHWTAGMPSRPFFWETARELPYIVDRISKEAFR